MTLNTLNTSITRVTCMTLNTLFSSITRVTCMSLNTLNTSITRVTCCALNTLNTSITRVTRGAASINTTHNFTWCCIIEKRWITFNINCFISYGFYGKGIWGGIIYFYIRRIYYNWVVGLVSFARTITKRDSINSLTSLPCLITHCDGISALLGLACLITNRDCLFIWRWICHWTMISGHGKII